MSEKNRKTIVVGVTGSIAAYKAADLVSRLVRESYEVHVIMTESACKLVTESTFFTLSRNPVITSFWELPEWRPGHISLAEKAALLVVAPCTANFIGKLANGIADDALSTYALSHSGKILLAPAMNTAMWKNPAVMRNCEILNERGVLLAGPGKGRLACGTEGEGRMLDPEKIIVEIARLVKK